MIMSEERLKAMDEAVQYGILRITLDGQYILTAQFIETYAKETAKYFMEKKPDDSMEEVIGLGITRSLIAHLGFSDEERLVRLFSLVRAFDEIDGVLKHFE